VYIGLNGKIHSIVCNSNFFDATNWFCYYRFGVLMFAILIITVAPAELLYLHQVLVKEGQ
jgi:hypothetical protein